jgi:hypothetical protein
MYMKRTCHITDRENFSQAKVLKDDGYDQIKVEFYDGGELETMWLYRPTRGRCSSSRYDYELVEELPKDCNSVAVDGWVERNGTAYYFDWSGDFASAPIMVKNLKTGEACYEPDYDNETKVCDYMQPQSSALSEELMSLIA